MFFRTETFNSTYSVYTHNTCNRVACCTSQLVVKGNIRKISSRNKTLICKNKEIQCKHTFDGVFKIGIIVGCRGGGFNENFRPVKITIMFVHF